MTLAKQSREPSWWQQDDTEYTNLHRPGGRGGLDRRSTGDVVPGLLQTQAYARAMNRGDTARSERGQGGAADHLSRGTAAVADRRARVQLWTVLDEAVVRRVVGSRAIMREQLSVWSSAPPCPTSTSS